MDSKCRKILLKDLNSVITCKLCQGYFIDATALTECLHVFCRACILRHFENSKTDCPICNTVYKKKTPACFKADPQIQSLVYKVVPSLFARESQRREDFYRSTGVRASSSCSDDSVIERERDLINDQEETISNYFCDKTRFINTEDLISLSLEYYQAHLDETGDEKKSKVNNFRENNNRKLSYINDTDAVVGAKITNDSECNENGDKDVTNDENGKNCDKRFLQCPAAVSMKHLQKFIRMKFGLTADHRVDIIYKGEVLKNDFSLMDVAYTFKWKKEKPLRFFYRIFTPQKVRPIKIRLEGEQLQVVPVKSDTQRPVLNNSHEEKIETSKSFLDELEDQNDHKKRLFEHLKLQPNQTEKETKKVPEKSPQKDCVFEYQEPDQEEIKRFAEIRDREWAMQKKLDEESKRNEEETFTYHISKKRKKNKHSKNESNTHKKRKLHAEIASNEEDLKLKVKITNNGHKHKHHKSSNQQFNEKDKISTQEMSSKEKLLQMRQVRHKHIPSDDKKMQTVPSLILSKDVNRIIDKPKVEDNICKPQNNSNKPIQNPEPVKVSEDIKKLKIKVPEPSTNVTESAVLLKQQTQPTSTSPKIGAFLESPSPNKTNFINVKEKEWTKKIIPAVQLERNTQAEKQAIKVQKTFQSYAEKYNRAEKVQQNKIESAKMSKETPQPKTDINKMTTNNNKLLEIKIENLRQRCTFEPKQPEKPEKKVVFSNAKNKIIPHYPPGFTVSKIEQGVKRKPETNDNINDKRPSLEITLINPPTSTPVQIAQKPPEKPPIKPPVKRPPPPTIPLEKIKKSVNLKSGISIIPKLPERCDNIGALDLSNKSPESSPRNSPKIESTNGVTITNRQLTTLSRTEKNPALSNLQMLSKVATEHPTLNNQNVVVVNKPRPQMPSLQTLKIPNLPVKTSNLQKLPKLNEIQKFRPQIRSVRPNQNQNIRNIPNPSALIRQHQTQNRITIGTQAESPSKSVAVTTAATPAPSPSPATVNSKDNGMKTMDITVQEKKEISV